jgi:hypothetical protein
MGVSTLRAGSEAEHSSRVARKIGRPIEGGLKVFKGPPLNLVP